MSIKTRLAFCYHTYRWGKEYAGGTKKVLRDYYSLYKTKGLTTDEYCEFEFEKRDEDFRKSFLGLNEQRYYLDCLNPVKYYTLARNKRCWMERAFDSRNCIVIMSRRLVI